MGEAIGALAFLMFCGFLLILQVAMIVAFFQIRTNTANTCSNLVITNQQLIAMRKLLETNFGEQLGMDQSTEPATSEEPDDSGSSKQ